MTAKAILALADGSVYDGLPLGAAGITFGEVVFNTSMTGYQEMLTDPSYGGQIVVPTYPLIGNYGVNDGDVESDKVQVSGFAVREECRQPSHHLLAGTLDEYLKANNITAVSGLDTRAVTRKLRTHGVMMGAIAVDMSAEETLAGLKQAKPYGETDFVAKVSAGKKYQWNEAVGKKYSVAVLDCGTKHNILRELDKLGCALTVYPCATSAADMLADNPDGIMLSPGPGDPELLDYIVENVKKLVDKKPIMGICLGNQIIARAFGGRNFKLKFGHRGANHPVRDLATGRVYITAQNHGYAVDADSLKDGLEVSHISLNDGTVEGLRHRELPIFTIQYHAEASPGPWDCTWMFGEFIKLMDGVKV
jgi:carbamoyl-phosphate synthase small subunit